MKKHVVLMMICILLCMIIAAPALAEPAALDLDPALEGELNYNEVGELTVRFDTPDSVAGTVYSLTLSSDSEDLTFYTDAAATDATNSLEIASDGENSSELVEATVYIKSDIAADQTQVATLEASFGSSSLGTISVELIGSHLHSATVSVEKDANGAILVNDRAEVTINLIDQAGAPYVATEAVNIALDCQDKDGISKRGKFFAFKFSGLNPADINFDDIDDRYTQEAIDAIDVPAGESSVKVYFQPKALEEQSSIERKIVVYYEDTITEEPLTAETALFTVKPAGASYVRVNIVERSKDEFIPYEIVGNAVPVEINLYDQYGNAQPGNGQLEIFLDSLTIPLSGRYAIADEEDYIPFTGRLKFYPTAACTPGTEITSLVLAAGKDKTTIYTNTTQSAACLIAAGLEGQINLVEVTDDEVDQYGIDAMLYLPDVADHMELWTNDEDATIRPFTGEEMSNKHWAKIKINAFDQYGNLTHFEDEGLTAQLYSTTGHFYDEDFNIITQARVQNSEFGKKFAPIRFMSSVLGDVYLSAVVPGLEVKDLKLTVQDAPPAEVYVCVHADNVYAGEWVEYHGELIDEDGKTNWNQRIQYKAYLNDATEPFYTNESYSIDWEDEYDNLRFQVPENVDYDDVIHFEASYGDLKSECVELRISDLTLYLNEGWNLISVPYTMANTHMQDIIDDVDKIDIAYEYVDGAWLEIDENTVIEPLKAYYVKLNDYASARICLDTAPTAPPVRELKAGWNLVGQAYDVLSDDYGMELMEAFQNIANDGDPQFNIVVSPALNSNNWFEDDAWVYTNNGSNQGFVRSSDYQIMAFNGYWVHMVEPGVLTGFSTTPVVHRTYYPTTLQVEHEAE